jgi:hypothetical protein
MENLHHRIAELEEAAEHAEREGHHDEAAELHKQARKVAMEIEGIAHQQKAHDIESKVERLHIMAAEAKEAGHHEEAEAMLREAKEMEHHLRGAAMPEKEVAYRKNLEHQVERMRDEISRLREDVEELKRISSASHQRADRI